MIPLSTRMRPNKLDDFIGQKHFMYKGSLFYNAICNKSFGSAIFFGSAGTGKTTLARIIAKHMDSAFVEINAADVGIKQLKEVIKSARDRFYGIERSSTYVYVDEFHRWNKLQQDTLLKALEEGVLSFIGSTTENPYFTINNAILSRVGKIYEFKSLTENDVLELLKRALLDKENGVGNFNLKLGKDALDKIVLFSNGDARVALDTLGFLAYNHMEGKSIDENSVTEAMQQKMSSFHRQEDFYDLLSALQKSIRGSDPDAAIHYLARLFKGNVDLRTISRRLMVIASEDIGNAYSTAAVIVEACTSAAERIGFPEAEIPLAHAVIMMAASPKSNKTYEALLKAKKDIDNSTDMKVPAHLRDNHYRGANSLGHGNGYLYPHNYGGFVKQQYLPDVLYKKEVKYYSPTDNGNEAGFKKYLKSLEELRD